MSDKGASAFQILMHRRSSFSAPTKFVPFTGQIHDGVPSLEIKHSIAITYEFLSLDGTNSKWYALYNKEGKRKPKHFSEDRRMVT